MDFVVWIPLVLLGPIFMVGTGAGIVNIVVPAHIQSLTPESFQSRVVSLINFSGQVFNPVAQGVFGGIVSCSAGKSI